MTYTLTAQQLSDMQADLGITGSQTVFTDAELHRNFDRAVGDYDKALVFAFRQLRNQAVRLTAYTAGATSEQRQQVFDHLSKVLVDMEKKAGVGGKITVGALKIGIDQVNPDTEDDEDA